uniref:Uncharacterized protein n=1 Tax=archaeon enrichment culture clone 1(2010) TaxID=795325 RepID=D9CGE5_9ARCH|nr:hypothetical protein pHA1_gp21 [archaeon enrichment culture clone 1(2010)]
MFSRADSHHLYMFRTRIPHHEVILKWDQPHHYVFRAVASSHWDSDSVPAKMLFHFRLLTLNAKFISNPYNYIHV